MLNYVKKNGVSLLILATLCVLVILVVFDINQMQEIKKMYLSNSNKQNEQDCINIENVYTEEPKQEDNTNETSKQETKEVAKIGTINMYSTNKWRVKIPKLKVDAPITEGTTNESLRRTVGHFTNTDKWKGNVALAGHNRGYKCNFFQEIKKLKVGDKIIYTTEKGEREYKVVLNKVIKETDWSYVEKTKDNRITLITCEMNKSAYRRCIQALEVQ